MSSLQTFLQSKIPNPKSQIPKLLLILLITAYTIYFSWYTINRHNTLNSYTADLSLIDQPMWNTVRGPGGFMELTWGDRQQPRLAEHFEPILIPLALLFFLWDDVRVLLIAQSLALALGALPVFWIARYQLTISNLQSPISNLQSPIQNPKSRSSPNGGKIQNWAALAFAAAYLLFPHLQAANIADFHADPFVVAPLLFAFWYATQKRWGWMWLWAAIAMLTKENLPTLTAMLGLWLLIKSAVGGRRSAVRHSLVLILASAVWFFIATFLIVTPLARQYFGTDGPIYLANRFGGGLAQLPSLLQNPARWQYLLGLLAAAGFLPLLAPEMLILGLPVLAANFLSNFPGQYSGEQHYSAPLVAAFTIAAIYGAARLVNRISLREESGWPLKQIGLIAISLWLLGWSLGYHSLHGWTPLSLRTETYSPTPASAQLPNLLRQIPPDAAVSASAGVHPHLAHRRVAYTFPIVQDATYLLVDITDIPGMHPNDARAQIMEMLNSHWSIVQATDGLILAQKSPNPPISSSPHLPNAFFNFARATTSPTYPTSLTFGNGRLRLLGYDVRDDPDDGVVFRFYWQAREPLPQNLKLWPLIYDEWGQLLSDPTQVPMVATVWHPPQAWQPNQTIVTETLPQLLPPTFHLGIAAGVATDSFYNPGRRLPLANPPTGQVITHASHWVQLATFTRQGRLLTRLPPTPSLQPLTPTRQQFGPDIQLTGFRVNPDPPPSQPTVPLLLEWTATRPPPADFTVFVHLLAPDGTIVAQHDAYPTWLAPQPTSQWQPHQPVPDSHILQLPANLPPATYTLQVGLYHPQTLERLPRPNGSDALQLARIQIR